MIFYQFQTKEGETYSNFDSIPNLQERLSKDTNTNRNIIRTLPQGKVHLIATDSDAKLLGRNKISKIVTEAYVELIPLLKEAEDRQRSQYTILAHNLITTHSRLQDSIESILPDKQIAKAENHSEQVGVALKRIETNAEDVAESILEIAKRIVDLQAQLEGFKMLSGDVKLDIGTHNIKHLLLNIVHPYYEELHANEVNIRWHIDESTAESDKIKTDYKILNVALHHLLNNAVKYSKPYSFIDIYFDFTERELKLSMISVRIERDEIEKIFNLRYSGKNTSSDMAGDGVGMYMVKKAITLLGGKVSIQADYSAKIEEVDGVRYTPNNFTIYLPDSQ